MSGRGTGLCEKPRYVRTAQEWEGPRTLGGPPSIRR